MFQLDELKKANLAKKSLTNDVNKNGTQSDYIKCICVTLEFACLRLIYLEGDNRTRVTGILGVLVIR